MNNSKFDNLEISRILNQSIELEGKKDLQQKVIGILPYEKLNSAHHCSIILNTFDLSAKNGYNSICNRNHMLTRLCAGLVCLKLELEAFGLDQKRGC